MSPQEKDDFERRVDEALEESFPSSDPPFFVGAGAQPGKQAPARKRPGDFGVTYGLTVSPWR